MKSLFLALTLLLSTSPALAADSDIGPTILSEYSRFKKMVSDLQPEFEVGGYLKGKLYGDHKLLWHISTSKDDNEVIRIFRDKGQNQQPFVVEYYFSHVIEDGHLVVRRFIGPAASGWRNDTVDFETEKYLGRQGSPNPYLDARDLEIVKQWEIRLFEN